MNVLIANCSYHNLGDVLMVESAINMVRSKYPSANIYFLGNDNPSKLMRDRHQAKSIFLNGNISLDNKIMGFIKCKIIERYNNYSKNKLIKIDVILDVNGYYIADKWSLNHARKQIGIYERLMNYDARLIMMPKSYGPFNHKDKIGVYLHLLSMSDVVFARDKLSYEYLQKINVSDFNLRLSSDYTSICKPIVDSDVSKYKDHAIIIINNRMIDGGLYSVSEYIKYIENIFNVIEGYKIKPVFVMHDRKKDVKFYNQYLLSKFNEVPIYTSKDPLNLKGISSVARIVFSSRFHGIINALNTFRPVIGTSWAHKYEYIAKEYGISDFILNPTVEVSELKEKVSMALNHNQYHIKNRSEIVKQRDEICENIKSVL